MNDKYEEAQNYIDNGITTYREIFQDCLEIARTDKEIHQSMIDQYGSISEYADAIFRDVQEILKNESYTNESKRSRIEKRLHEQDVEIEVKHEGILEVPDGKNVDDLPFSHFEKLAKKKGLSKITKALNNLQVWNKNDDPKLSKWAGNMIDKLTDKLGKEESFVRESLGWEVVHEADDDDGNPTMWGAKINSDKYGKFIWVEVSDNGYDVVIESGKDNYKTLKSFKTIGRAKKYAEQLSGTAKKESLIREGTRGYRSPWDAAQHLYQYGNFEMWSDKIRDELKRNGYDDDFISDTFEHMYDMLDEDEMNEDDYFDESLIRKESHDRYDPNIEARFIDDSATFLRNDIPNESYFVGASKTKPRTYGTMGDTLYDEIFTFDNDFDEAWHTATVWNMRGYWVEFDRALDGDVVEKNLFKPNEMKKYLNTPLRKESRSLGGRDYGNIDPVLQEYLDFLDEAGIRVVNVVPKTKMIYVDSRGFDDAVFYMQGRDYFGKDLYSKGWTVATQA